jgi:hypothetical protein
MKPPDEVQGFNSSESALDLGLAACLAFMLMNLSALQVVNLVVVAGDRAAGPCRA